MRSTLPAVVLAVAVGAAYFAARLATAPAPQPATARELLADPDHYHGRRVTVRTAGFEAGEGGTVVFRRVLGRPPVIVAHLPTGSDGVPPVVSGVFTRGVGDSPHVIRPAP